MMTLNGRRQRLHDPPTVPMSPEIQVRVKGRSLGYAGVQASGPGCMAEI